MLGIKRREVIMLLASAAVTCPLAGARAAGRPRAAHRRAHTG